MSDSGQDTVKTRTEAMLARNKELRSAHEQRLRKVAFLPGPASDRDWLCRWSSLCEGILPLFGSLVAFAALAAVAVMA